MKNSTMTTIYDTLNAIDFENKDAVLAELYAELHRNDKAKAEKNAAYDEARDIVLNVLRHTTTPLTVGEIFTEVEATLPSGFTKNKISYGLTHQWAEDVVKIEGKVNTYRIK